MDRLLEGVTLVDTIGDPSGVEVTSVEHDSASVGPGALFCCIPGLHHDGHDFAPDAVSRGAVALLVERPLDLPVAQAVVRRGQIRPAMAQLAATFYEHPADAMAAVAVTGTNGKTTVTHLLASILDAHGMRTAVIGTLAGPRTTPEAPELQRMLAAARRDGMDAVAMEVSSHALDANRVDGVRFAAGVFTNLGHDHLDHHHTMDAYFAAKASLFSPERVAVGVVNADDRWGRKLIEDATVPMVSFSPSNDVSDIRTSVGATSFTWRGRRVVLALTGSYHVDNALAAATTAVALGVPDETVAAGLAAAGPVPGRFEVVPSEAPFTVVVDYAHTPDGLSTALDSARGLAGEHRVVCVFGCGGDRDVEKRPVMGRVAGEGADLVVLTSDNPRSEDPLSIIEQVRAGFSGPAELIVEPDRRRAIGVAVASARPGDVVVLAGKGHEGVIEVAGQRLPFDDKVEAIAALAAMSGWRQP